MSTSTVQLSVRIRGLKDHHGNIISSGAPSTTTMKGATATTTDHLKYTQSLITTDPKSGEEHVYHFDRVFDHQSHLNNPPGLHGTPAPPPTQPSSSVDYDQCDTDHNIIYEEVGKPAIKAYMEEGRSTTILAHGETGTGKTYTLVGSRGIPKLRGLIFRMCREVFDRNASLSNNNDTPQQGSSSAGDDDDDDAIVGVEKKVEYGIQALEIYDEALNDLLTNRCFWPTAGHKLRLDRYIGGQTGTFDCSTIPPTPCANYSEVEDCIHRADRNRFSTLHQACRAHVIYRLIRTTTTTTITLSGKRSKSISKVDLNFVDLAGSERSAAASAVARGCMLREGLSISAAFSNLHSTIRAVRDGTFVPYRNSKLTMLLQQSIGKGHVALIATVSPATMYFTQSLATLRYTSALMKKELPPNPNDGGPKTTINAS